MTPTLYWITDRLAIGPRPRGGDWLADEVRAWKEAGVSVVVSALTTEETAELDLVQEGFICRAAGLEFVSLPIPDRELPSSREQVVELAAAVKRRLDARVLVHCRQGIGRSTILAVAILVACGDTAEQALDRIARVRGPVPDTADQRRWILELSGTT